MRNFIKQCVHPLPKAFISQRAIMKHILHVTNPLQICRRGDCKYSDGKYEAEDDSDNDIKGDVAKGPFDNTKDDDINDNWDIINIIPNGDGTFDDCMPKDDDCKGYTGFLGNMFGPGNFLENIFNKIFVEFGACSNDCKKKKK
ncbi:hypothetical protein SK128_000807 [Halocaridina rubra]|uniref:Uncharacterized protein n=1 Tax=Halocaridina rubra TaxID=373956 RepID=A0AAN8ZY52_HALRR